MKKILMMVSSGMHAVQNLGGLNEDFFMTATLDRNAEAYREIYDDVVRPVLSGLHTCQSLERNHSHSRAVEYPGIPPCHPHSRNGALFSSDLFEVVISF